MSRGMSQSTKSDRSAPGAGTRKQTSWFDCVDMIEAVVDNKARRSVYGYVRTRRDQVG